MKKETIEKLFKRYTSIFNDAVIQTTGKPLDEHIINEINSNVDQLFKDYEHIDSITNFIGFSKKINEIILDVIDKCKKLHTDNYREIANKTFWKFNNDPLTWVDKELEEMSKMVIQDKEHYYIPANPSIDKFKSLQRSGKFNFKIEMLNNHDGKIKQYNNISARGSIFTSEQLNKNNVDKKDEKYSTISSYIKYNTLMEDAYDVPMQYGVETYKKYFYGDFGYALLAFKNSVKNKIISKAINIGLTPKNEDYEKQLRKIFQSNEVSEEYIKQIQLANDIIDIQNLFINSLSSIDKILEKYKHAWSILLNNNSLNFFQKRNLLKKYNYIVNNLDKFIDVSIIRFDTILKNIGNSSPSFIDKNDKFIITYDYIDHTNDVIYNQLNVEFQILLNELETIVYKENDKNEFIIDLNEEKYFNVINTVYKVYDNAKNELNTHINKLTCLYHIIKQFNKKYKYDFIWKYVKSLFNKKKHKN